MNFTKWKRKIKKNMTRLQEIVKNEQYFDAANIQPSVFLDTFSKKEISKLIQPT